MEKSSEDVWEARVGVYRGQTGFEEMELVRERERVKLQEGRD